MVRDDGQYICVKLFSKWAGKQSEGGLVAFFVNLRSAFDYVDFGWKCCEEIRDRNVRRKGVSKWEEEKIGYFEEKGMKIREVEGRRREGRWIVGR